MIKNLSCVSLKRFPHKFTNTILLVPFLTQAKVKNLLRLSHVAFLTIKQFHFTLSDSELIFVTIQV